MHHEEVIFAALQEINASIKAGSKLVADHTKAIQHLIQTVSALQKKVDAMSDPTKAILDAFTTELNALIARAGTNATAATDLAEVLAQLQTLTTQAHAAATV